MNIFTLITALWTITALVLGVMLTIELAGIRAAQTLLEERGLNGAMKSLLHRDLIMVTVRTFMAYDFFVLGFLILVASGTPVTRTAFSITQILCVASLATTTRTDRISRGKIANGEKN